jgi:hypothetical protein
MRFGLINLFDQRNERDSVTIKFEIAPPGNPGGFKTYLQGKARRRKPAKPAGVELKKQATDCRIVLFKAGA